MGTDDEPYMGSGGEDSPDAVYVSDTYSDTSGGGSAETIKIGRDNVIFGINFGWLTSDVGVIGYDNKGNESSSNWAHIDASHNISDYLPQFLSNANQANEYMANVYNVIAQQKTPLTEETDRQMQNYVETESRKAQALQYGSVAEDGLPQDTASYNSQPMQVIGDQINVNNTTDNGKPKTLNYQADEVFYQLHPELSGMTIADVTKNNPVLGRQLAQEWQGIKDGIQQNSGSVSSQGSPDNSGMLPMQTSSGNFLWRDYYGSLSEFYQAKGEQYKSLFKDNKDEFNSEFAKWELKNEGITENNTNYSELLAKRITSDAQFNQYMMSAVASMNPLGVAEEGLVLGERLSTEVGSGTLSQDLINLSESHVSDTGKTVLGHFEDITGTGNYIDKAQRLNASYFDLGDVFDTLSPAEQQAANLHFLDTISANGDNVLLSVPKTLIRPGSALQNEIEYLINNKSYQWVNQWALKVK
jgi:hypothetical protein